MDLNNDTFIKFAAGSYTMPHFIESEFYSDLKRIKYIKKLIQKYRIYNDLKERLIINHMIMLYNVFDMESCTKMLFFRINPEDYSTLKTFLCRLGVMPEYLLGINGKTIYFDDIELDPYIKQQLEKI